MGNDLKERMSEWWEYDHGRVIDEAKARIEELEEALTEKMLSELSALGQAQEAYECQRKLEAKLATATETLNEIAKPRVGPDVDWSEEEVNAWRATWYRKYGDMARTTLKETK